MVFKFNSAKAISYVNNYFGGANPFYYVFSDEKEGVNFISQCVFAGCDGFVANCPEWFYQNEKNFSQSWVDGEKLKEFLLSKNTCGPLARVVPKRLVTVGDLVFWKKDCGQVGAGIVTKMVGEEIFFATKENFVSEKSLNLVEEKGAVLLHIFAVKK